MVYCSKCGSQMPDAANFCGGCGAPAGSGTAAAAAYSPDPLEYAIVGDNLQIARVRLRPGQQVYAEAGKMVYKTPNVEWETRMTGETLGEKLLGALKRTVTGESLFVTYFRSNGAGEVGFAGSYPGFRQQLFSIPVLPLQHYHLSYSLMLCNSVHKKLYALHLFPVPLSPYLNLHLQLQR